MKRTVLALTLIIALAISAVAGYWVVKTHSPHLLWQIGIPHFVNDIAFVDGKVVITTDQGVYGYGADSGRLLWSSYIDSGGGELQVRDEKLYMATRGSTVHWVDENSGETILAYHGPAWTTISVKGYPQRFLIADGRVFVIGSGTAVFNASTGEVFWEITSPDNARPSNTVTILGPASVSALESSYVYMESASRINPNNGEILWSASRYRVPLPIVVDNQVIFWDNREDVSDEVEDTIYGQGMVSIDATSGERLWNYDVGAEFFEPTVYNDLLLCGANDGYFYAINVSNGTLAWKTKVDPQDFMQGSNLPVQNSSRIGRPSASPVLVDSQGNTVTWAYLIAQMQINGDLGNNLYVGCLTTLSLSDGQILRTTHIQNNSLIYRLELVSLKRTFFLNTGSALWFISKDTGKVLDVESQHTDALLAANNRVYIARGLHLFAYG